MKVKNFIRCSSLVFGLFAAHSQVFAVGGASCTLERTESGIWVLNYPGGTLITDSFDEVTAYANEYCGIPK